MIFKEYYLQNFSKVYKYFYYRCGTEVYAEDLSSEVFTRILEKERIKDYNNLNIKTLYSYCNYIYKEWVRKKIRENRIEFLDNYKEYSEYIDSLEDFQNGDHEERIDRYRNILIEEINKLDGNVKEVIKMRYLQNMKYSEIAKAMNISVDDVNTYRKRGIKYLKSGLINKNCPVPYILLVII